MADTGQDRLTSRAPEQTTRPRALRLRRVLIVAVYSLFTVWLLLMSTPLGVVLAGESWDGPVPYGVMPVVVFKWLSLGGYVVVAATAGRSVVAVQWIVAGIAAWAVTETVSPQDPAAGLVGSLLPYAVNLVLVVGPWLLLAPERRELVRVRPRPDRPSLDLVVAALVPLAAWALWAASVVGPGLPAELAEFHFDLVALPVSLGVIGLLAALRPRGARWLLGVVAATTAACGALDLALATTAVGAPPRAAGVALVLAGAFLAWRASRSVT